MRKATLILFATWLLLSTSLVAKTNWDKTESRICIRIPQVGVFDQSHARCTVAGLERAGETDEAFHGRNSRQGDGAG